jgi:hypothetical protein
MSNKDTNPTTTMSSNPTIATMSGTSSSTTMSSSSTSSSQITLIPAPTLDPVVAKAPKGNPLRPYVPISKAKKAMNKLNILMKKRADNQIALLAEESSRLTGLTVGSDLQSEIMEPVMPIENTDKKEGEDEEEYDEEYFEGEVNEADQVESAILSRNCIPEKQPIYIKWNVIDFPTSQNICNANWIFLLARYHGK